MIGTKLLIYLQQKVEKVKYENICPFLITICDILSSHIQINLNFFFKINNFINIRRNKKKNKMQGQLRI